ncbi:MAG: type II secretion system protein [Bacillota bacterium]
MRNRAQTGDQGGLTLVEILVALTILLITVVAFVPLFVYISEGSQANRARLTAQLLAASVIEEIRALPYDHIGTVGGNPDGAVEHETTVNIEGRDYTVRTDIWWVDDESDNDAGGNDTIPYDYKRVRVTVAAPGFFTGAVTITEDIRTLASLEGEEEAFPGGNILALAQRGWQTTPGGPVPVEGVKVELTAGPNAPQTMWTAEDGRALFAVLEEGIYTVAADAGDLGMMVRPDQVEQSAEVTNGVTNSVVFQVEFPCYLDIELVDESTGSPVNAGGTLILNTPFGDLHKTFTAGMGGALPPDFLGELWPVGEGYAGAYNLQVLAEGYVAFDLSEHREVWDGTFRAPGETKNLTIPLTPATAGVTVTAEGSGMPVNGASVEIYRHTYTYDAENGWTDTCAPLENGTAVTRTDGRASFVLPDNDPYAPPAEPRDGDRYTRYCVKVTADGYDSFGPAHDAFWVTGGRQMTGAGPVETYGVTLRPNFRSIRVRTEYPGGYPRNNVLILVEGPGGYSEQKSTGAQGVPGEALFENLGNHKYDVYRKSGENWVDHREVDVDRGEYFVLYTF